MSKFESAEKTDLVKVLEPFEGLHLRPLRDWAHKVLDTSSDIDRSAARVALNALDLLEKLE
jgi:hypothetical protein